LDYVVVDRAGRQEPHRYGVPLLKTRPHFGGVRYWFGSPQCARRVGALYLPAGARRFACRHCLSLVYRSQQAHDKFLDPYRRMDPVTRWARLDRLEESHVSTPAPDFAAMSVGDLVQWLRADFRAQDKEERVLRTFRGPMHSPEFYDKRWVQSQRTRTWFTVINSTTVHSPGIAGCTTVG
jgi:hypothetical protein